MIVSFHPLFEGDRYINCAGRTPGPKERSAIQAADAVILPQGCRAELYWMAHRHCPRVFPNYRVRFLYPGKIGQIRLFRETGIPHPASRLFSDLRDYRRHRPGRPPAPDFEFPLLFKFDWGGEGDTVFRLETRADLDAMLQRTADLERADHKGFLLQRWVACGHRSLRVAVIGRRRYTYWRVGSDVGAFHSTVSRGARIDCTGDRDLQQAGAAAVDRFCRCAGIDLAGFDLLFEEGAKTPLFLEINWYFGRRALGGSEAYYDVLLEEIRAWLADRGLKSP